MRTNKEKVTQRVMSEKGEVSQAAKMLALWDLFALKGVKVRSLFPSTFFM